MDHFPKLPVLQMNVRKVTRAANRITLNSFLFSKYTFCVGVQHCKCMEDFKQIVK